MPCRRDTPKIDDNIELITAMDEEGPHSQADFGDYAESLLHDVHSVMLLNNTTA